MSVEPCARTPLSVRIPSVAATICARGNTMRLAAAAVEFKHHIVVLQVAQHGHQVREAADVHAVDRRTTMAVGFE